jgi:cell division protein ZapA
MAAVTLRIGGRAHVVACRDGGEAQLDALGQRLDALAPAATRAAGAAGGERVMLLIALMLADALTETERNAAAPPVRDATLDTIAERLEALANTLEKTGATD